MFHHLSDLLIYTESYWDYDFCHASPSPPLATGLYEYVHSKLSPLREHYIKASLLSLYPESPPTALTSKPISIDAPILFGAAGTGETRRILDMLAGAWGMYAIAPGLNPYEKERNIVQPSYSGASRDTWSLWQDMNQIKAIIGCDFFNSQVQQMIDAWIWSREDLLAHFLIHHKGWKQTTSSEHWMRLQITCTEDFDPFDACWRLFRLIRYCGLETVPETKKGHYLVYR